MKIKYFQYFFSILFVKYRTLGSTYVEQIATCNIFYELC
jgi:hypothetical protein